MRIADEESANMLLNAEVDHFVGALVPHVPNAPLGPATLLVFGLLQALPAPGVLFAPGLLFGEFSQLLRPLAFERTDTSPGDDQPCACVGGDGC
jgi:hypothetical protein